MASAQDPPKASYCSWIQSTCHWPTCPVSATPACVFLSLQQASLVFPDPSSMNSSLFVPCLPGPLHLQFPLPGISFPQLFLRLPCHSHLCSNLTSPRSFLTVECRTVRSRSHRLHQGEVPSQVPSALAGKCSINSLLDGLMDEHLHWTEPQASSPPTAWPPKAIHRYTDPYSIDHRGRSPLISLLTPSPSSAPPHLLLCSQQSRLSSLSRPIARPTPSSPSPNLQDQGPPPSGTLPYQLAVAKKTTTRLSSCRVSVATENFMCLCVCVCAHAHVCEGCVHVCTSWLQWMSDVFLNFCPD